MVEQDVTASVNIPDPRLADLPDPLGHGSLIGAAEFVVQRRTVKPDGPTSLPACGPTNDPPDRLLYGPHLQHLSVQRQVGHDLLQPSILGLELLEPLHLGL